MFQVTTDAATGVTYDILSLLLSVEGFCHRQPTSAPFDYETSNRWQVCTRASDFIVHLHFVIVTGAYLKAHTHTHTCTVHTHLKAETHSSANATGDTHLEHLVGEGAPAILCYVDWRHDPRPLLPTLCWERLSDLQHRQS